MKAQENAGDQDAVGFSFEADLFFQTVKIAENLLHLVSTKVRMNAK